MNFEQHCIMWGYTEIEPSPLEGYRVMYKAYIPGHNRFRALHVASGFKASWGGSDEMLADIRVPGEVRDYILKDLESRRLK